MRSNPERVFNAMLENSLRTTGVTDRLVASNGTQGLDQTIQLMTSPLHLAHAHTILSQSGQGAASVTTETIGTPEADYVRYLDVQQKVNGAAKPFDFSKVADLWGKSATPKDATSTETTGELYDQTVLAVVPIGNLPLKGRRELLNQIKAEKVYTADYSNVRRSVHGGRPVYTYDVSINAEAYVGMLKNFARQSGYTHLEQVDPTQYAGGEPINVVLSIDVWTRQLSRIDYEGGSRTETFSSFGGQFRPKVPADTIPIEELQTQVQLLQ